MADADPKIVTCSTPPHVKNVLQLVLMFFTWQLPFSNYRSTSKSPAVSGSEVACQEESTGNAEQWRHFF